MIEVDKLEKRFGPTEAVRGIDLRVEQGECLGLIGPNGAGKTTTLKALATLVKPDTGRIVVGGIDAVAEPRLVRRIVGYMPDIFQSYGDMKVLHYLDYFAALVGLRGPARVRHVQEVLELVDLLPKRDALVGGLSRGVKQRLCLAKTLLHAPKVLLLDEPASGLDPRARIEIRLLLRELRGMGKTIVISSHILEDLEEICDRIAIIEAGQVIAQGALEALKREARKGRRLVIEPRLDLEAAHAALAGSPDVAKIEIEGRTLRVVPTDPDADGTKVLRTLVDAGVAVRAFRDEEPDLAQVFLELTRGEIA